MELNEHLDKEYGKIGTPKRNRFEAGAISFIVGQSIKELRLQQGLTQQDLAIKVGTKKSKSYISRIERGTTFPRIDSLVSLFSALGKELLIVTK